MMQMTNEDDEFLQLPIMENLTKSDEERMAELYEGLKNNNFDIVVDPRDQHELIRMINEDDTDVHGSLPPESENWPGNYNFLVDFAITDKISAYSISRDKLYLVHNFPFAFVIKTEQPAPPDSYLRIMSVFIDPQFAKFDVHRCYDHAVADYENGIGAPDHIIRCNSQPGKYVRNSLTLRRSLILPFNFSNSAELSVMHELRFMCLSSCTGGMNRRRIKVIFTLETFSGEVIGRRSLEVKICRDPLKSLEADDKVAARSVSFPAGNLEQLSKHSSSNPPKKPRLDAKSKKREIRNGISQFFKQACDAYHKTNPTTGGPYVIEVRNKEEYDVLMNAKSIYEFTICIQGLQPPEFKPKKPKKERNV